MSALIQFRNVSFRYPDAGSDSLHGIDLSIEEGQFTAVLGHNGSGKSTLARLMNGLLLPTEGSVCVAGLDTANASDILRIRQTVGLVFQNPDNQIVSNVVEEDVAFAPENLGIPPLEIRERVDAALKQVGMYEYRQHAPHLLSGGQKQRVAIAGVLAMQPKILVLDEPTAMLDPQGRKDVLSILLSLCRSGGMTVILITHHMEECISADRLIVMSNGSVSMDAAPADVFSDVEGLEREGLDVPETARLISDLKKLGLPLSGETLSAEACARQIAEAAGRSACRP
ncbi:MAG: energy-coupling factor transporter ATPase [Oscillospiraceae bacterium]|nr:energy-coupling factor transporter ATPase [Oscillospiraceae bacterium]